MLSRKTIKHVIKGKKRLQQYLYFNDYVTSHNANTYISDVEKIMNDILKKVDHDISIDKVSFRSSYQTTSDMPDEWHRRAMAFKNGVNCCIDALEDIINENKATKTHIIALATLWIAIATLISTIIIALI